MNDKIENYYQLKLSCRTQDAMGANFINSILEEMGRVWKNLVSKNLNQELEIIMCILSNYTPDCVVEAWVECDVKDLGTVSELSAEEFEMMKDGVFIVNTAKGGVINEVTLIDYIENKKVAGAALDVFETEPKPEIQILMNPSLSLSPHVGGSTLEAQERIGTELAQQIIDLQKLI
jgi:lactate dehydrogenase-like 2-hydroxyacid dehydrogenase